MTTLHEQAWDLIRLHVGHENPLQSADLSRALSIGDDHRGTRVTRALITDLIRQGYPIGATGQGFFVIQTSEELERYCRELSSRAAGILARSRNVQRAFATYYRGAPASQPRLEGFGDG